MEASHLVRLPGTRYTEPFKSNTPDGELWSIYAVHVNHSSLSTPCFDTEQQASDYWNNLFSRAPGVLK